jgi:aspartyl-tRNA(Asn)/glutamyl-tRNA(Gln) amidotransferase subunit A
MHKDDLTHLSASELLEAYRVRSFSPVEVTTAVLERIEELNPRLNAFLRIDAEGALEAARKAERSWLQPGEKPLLCGVPVSIKDLLYTTWLPTTHGSLAFKDYVHPANSPAVDRLLAAGAVIVGKTNTPEFGLLDVTRNRFGDDCRNPWNLEHTAGGSSGGAGAAVAAGLAPIAIGTDGAGSIRIPACYTGIYGLKPTFGRIPHDGWRGAPHTSHQGPMTRTVRDAALVMQICSGPDVRDRLCLRKRAPDFIDALTPRSLSGVKVAMSIDYGYMDVDPEIAQAVREAAGLLRDLGCDVFESHPPQRPGGATGLDMLSPDEYAYALSIKPDFDSHFDKLTDYGRRVMEGARAMPAWRFSPVTESREAWSAATRTWSEGFDFFLAPVMSETAPRCDAPPVYEQKRPWPGNFLPIFNASGMPAASVPFGLHSNGLPLAVQLAGRFGDDAGVLRLSAAIEAARPWAADWPAMASGEASIDATAAAGGQ